MNSGLRVGVGGALGRMGVAVAAMVRGRAGSEVAARFDRPHAVDTDGDPAPLISLAESLALCDVIIDFSTGEATATLARAAAAVGGPALILGATGLSDEQNRAVAEAAARVAIVQSGNYSVGVNVLAGLVEQAARRLGPEIWDIEVFEAHHRRKVDAPSGTALLLANAAARGRGRLLGNIRLPVREGLTGPRPAGGIGMAAMRGGGIIGEHSVVFAADEEVITLSHSARDRALFARGAVEAAAWVAGKPPGLYDMVDVLGFRD